MSMCMRLHGEWLAYLFFSHPHTSKCNNTLRVCILYCSLFYRGSHSDGVNEQFFCLSLLFSAMCDCHFFPSLCHLFRVSGYELITMETNASTEWCVITIISQYCMNKKNHLGSYLVFIYWLCDVRIVIRISTNSWHSQYFIIEWMSV